MRVFPGEEYAPAFMTGIRRQARDRPELAHIYGLTDPYQTT